MPAGATPDTSVSDKQNFDTDVIYQIVTDRFLDGNSANNPTGAAFSSGCTQLKLYCGGDWQGIVGKINDGYLTGMGITAIWISQPVEYIYAIINYSGVDNTAYHGYWARDFKKTNPAFGSLTDFQSLISAAHGTLLGGYTGDSSGYFHHYGGTDFSSYENGIYKNLYDLADLNHNNSTIDGYFKAAIKLWLDQGIDGIRFDAVKHMPFGWQKNLMSYINGYKPVFSFGEWFLGTGEIDSKNHYFANESGMSLLDFRYAQKVRQVLRDGTDTMYGRDSMLSVTAADYNVVNDQVTFIDNHDMDRFQVSGASGRKLEQALALTLTSRGVPAIYYGTEQYMSGNGDPNNRARMTSFSTTTTAYNVIKTLAPLRKSNPAVAYGTTQQRWINNDVYIYERKFGNNVAVVTINRNLSGSASIDGLITSLPAGTYADVLGGALNGNTITAGSGGAVSAFTLAAGGVAVWQYTTSATAPIVAHAGPMMAAPGGTVTIDGRGFGAAAGTMYFGTTAVSGTGIVSWEDTEIKVKVPSVPAGKYGVKVATSGGTNSNVYNNLNVLSGSQVSVRFVVNNATTVPGENVYLAGSVAELGNWSTDAAIGSFFNQVVYAYPTWYYDVSVPAGAAIQFKFIKKNGTTVTWEGGSNHTFTAPSSGTATVNVNWQP